MKYDITFTIDRPGTWKKGDKVAPLPPIGNDDAGDRSTDIAEACEGGAGISGMFVIPEGHRLYYSHAEAIAEFIHRCDLSLRGSGKWNSSPLGYYWVALLSYQFMRMARRVSRHPFNPPPDAQTA